MKKYSVKFLALFLAMCLILGLGASALADENGQDVAPTTEAESAGPGDLLKGR